MTKCLLEGPRLWTIFSFCDNTLCMNYQTETFLLVSSSVRSKQLLYFVRGQGQKTNKNIQQRTLSRFITIALYLL